MNQSMRTESLMQQTEEYKSNPFQSTDPDDPLRMEQSWGDVAKGLDRILFGYLILLLCAFAVGFIIIVILDQSAATKTGTKEERENALIFSMWVIYLGLGLVSLAILMSSWVILSGKIRCAINSSDRFGARWFIFACLICMATGPIMNVAISIGLRMSPDEMELVQAAAMDGEDPIPVLLTTRVGLLNILLSAISFAGTVFFALFLRAVGKCFDDPVLVTMVDFYLVFNLVVVSASSMFYAQMFNNIYSAMIGLGMMFGLFAAGIWYVVLIFYTRVRIATKLAQLKSPLEMQ